MLRTILLLAAGAALGAAALHLAPFRSEPGGAPPGPVRAQAPAPDRAAVVAAPADRAAPDAADTGPLERQALAVAAEPPSPDRTLRLAALLLRHAETDPAGAVRLAGRVRADDAVTRLLFIAWARADMEAALAEIAALPDREEARAIAMGVLGSIGNDDDNAERLARALPAAERSMFLAEAIAARGDASPRAALRQALAIEDGGARTLALARLAKVWGATDPRQALLHLDAIAGEQERETFRFGVLAEWARTEPHAVLDYAAELDGVAQQRVLLGIVHQVPEEQLAALLTEADRFEPQTALLVRRSAAQRLAQTDPAHAVSVLATLPPRERQPVQHSIGYAYGAKDPEAALAWARSLDPPDPQVMRSVVAGIATADPQRALDVALALESPLEREQAVGAIATMGFRGGRDFEHVLDRLAGIDDAALRARAVQMALGAWSSTEPQRAFDWLVANAHRVPADAFQHVGAQLARQDPGAAAAFTDRIPQAARPRWIAAVASGYAARDPEGALAWISQYRNDPAYRDAVTNVAVSLAQHDGAAAARLLETRGSLDGAAGAVGTVVAQWAQQDPMAAAAWAARLEPRARSMALTVAAQHWSVRDPEGARRWALGLPAGDARDTALAALSASPFSRSVPDEEVLAAFSDDAARDRALVQMAVRLAQTGAADQARMLVDQRISDQRLRAQAHSMLERAGELRQTPLFLPSEVPTGAFSAVPGVIGAAPGAAVNVLAPAPVPAVGQAPDR